MTSPKAMCYIATALFSRQLFVYMYQSLKGDYPISTSVT